MTEANTRRLAAVLSLDAVGYSRLMADDEDATVRTLNAYRQEIARLVALHGGRVVDSPGDNALCEFASASAAVSCALEIQQTISAQNAQLVDARRMDFRVGIHLGEVLSEDGRIYGDGVNIAARLEGIADAGGVCVSSAVRDAVSNKLDVAFDDFGERALKNIPNRVRVFAARAVDTDSVRQAPRLTHRRRLMVGLCAVTLVAAGVALWWSRLPDRADAVREAVAHGDTTRPTPSDFIDRPAIAVLPFDNFSSDRDQAYFADGLAEDLITRLSMWRSFPVISRTASFQYRGADIDLKRVSEDLGVRYVVEGSVRKSGDRIRVAAQLIDATSGKHLWADTFDRVVDDVFALQDEISATIAASLVSDLELTERKNAGRREPTSLEAWGAYQVGMGHYEQMTPDETRSAIGYFQRAVELDHTFAQALARLSTSLTWSVAFGTAEDPDGTLRVAIERAREAAEIDPRDWTAPLALTFAQTLSGNLEAALVAGRKGIEMNPSSPEAMIFYGFALNMAGRAEESIEHSRRALRFSPRGPFVGAAYDNISTANFILGRYDDALAAARRVIEERPGYYLAYLDGAIAAAGLGRLEEAKALVQAARGVQPALTLDLIHRSLGVPNPEVDARRDEFLRLAGVR